MAQRSSNNKLFENLKTTHCLSCLEAQEVEILKKQGLYLRSNG
jgi:hypothetical protein